MKRLITLSLALVIGFSFLTTVLIPKDAEAIDAKLMGVPVRLDIVNGYIEGVVVQLKRGWVNSGAMELDIEITGINGEPNIWHGHQIVPVSTTTILDEFRDVAEVRVAWDDKVTVQHEVETYYVSLQILVAGLPFGDKIQVTFSNR